MFSLPGLLRAAAPFLTLLLALWVTGRPVAIAPHWRVTLAHPLDLLRVTDHLSLLGGSAGAIAGLVVFGWRGRLALPVVADLYGAVAPLGLAVHAGGCLIRGDCYGRSAPALVGIVFPGMRLPRYPVELYAAAVALVIYAGVQWLTRRPCARGTVALATMGALSTTRALLDAFRLRVASGPVSAEQLVLLAVAAAAAVLLTWRLIATRRTAPRVPFVPGQQPVPSLMER